MSKLLAIYSMLQCNVVENESKYGITGVTSLQLHGLLVAEGKSVGNKYDKRPRRTMDAIKKFNSIIDLSPTAPKNRRSEMVSYRDKNNKLQPMIIVDLTTARAFLSWSVPTLSFALVEAIDMLLDELNKVTKLFPETKELIEPNVLVAMAETTRFQSRDVATLGANMLIGSLRKVKADKTGKLFQETNLSQGEGTSIFNTLFKMVYGISATQYKKRFGVDNPRDYIDADGLGCIAALQNMAGALIMLGFTGEELKDKLKESFRIYKVTNKLPFNFLPIQEPKERLTSRFRKAVAKQTKDYTV